MTFGSEQEKNEFSDKLNFVRDLLTPPRAARLDNQALMRTLFDCAQKHHVAQPSRTAPAQPTRGTFLGNVGMWRVTLYMIQTCKAHIAILS